MLAGRFIPLISALVLWAGIVAAADSEVPVPEAIEFQSSVGGVDFPHRAHAEDFGVECVTCHHETEAPPLDLPHPHYFEDGWEECLSCHREPTSGAKVQSCSSCHPEAPFTVADETLSSKVVIHRSCWSCHETGRGEEASSQCAFCHLRESSSSPTSVDPEAR